jgi:hypothetical protein
LTYPVDVGRWYVPDVNELLTALDEAERQRDEWREGCRLQVLLGDKRLEKAERENERLREALHQIAHLTILPTDNAAMVYGRAVRMTVLAGAALDAVRVPREEG